MFTLALAFIAGCITVLSPCVLPLLPVILAGVAGEGRARPFGILIGFVAAFALATLSLAALVNALGLPADVQRHVSVVILALIGLCLLVPALQLRFEMIASRWLPVTSGRGRGFGGGLMLGAGLGLAWTPCVGPVMASVMTLAMAQQLDAMAVLTTLAFAFGTALPMLGIIIGGRGVVQRLRWFQVHGRRVQQGFGLLLIGTALAIWWGLDRTMQGVLLDWLPNWEQMLTHW